MQYRIAIFGHSLFSILTDDYYGRSPDLSLTKNKPIIVMSSVRRRSDGIKVQTVRTSQAKGYNIHAYEVGFKN